MIEIKAGKLFDVTSSEYGKPGSRNKLLNQFGFDKSRGFYYGTDSYHALKIHESLVSHIDDDILHGDKNDHQALVSLIAGMLENTERKIKTCSRLPFGGRRSRILVSTHYQYTGGNAWLSKAKNNDPNLWIESDERNSTLEGVSILGKYLKLALTLASKTGESPFVCKDSYGRDAYVWLTEELITYVALQVQR